MKRIFVALKIEYLPEIDQLLTYLKNNLVNDRIKWVETGNLHLTLKFFGETHDDKVKLIVNALTDIKHFEPLKIVFTTTSIFGSSYNPKVIWLGIEKNDVISNLVEKLNVTIRELGYEPDRQNFVPHLTLGRINFLTDKEYFQEIIKKSKSISLACQTINSFHLFESKLQPTGPKYSIIKTYYLGN